VVTDHDAEDRETLEGALGMGTTAADKRVKTGIDTVQETMAAGRIRIMRGCVVERDPRMEDVNAPIGFVEEIVAYVWNMGGGRVAKEEPVKVHDDGMDAARYAVMEVLDPSASGVRWM
jgi:phage terminase large subunit